MLLNKDTKITGNKVILIPYKKEHVLKYHGWMMDEKLRELTASEPLSIDEEYEMQKSWMSDENKCTFIVLDKELYSISCNEIDAMIGDTNLFLLDLDGAKTAEAEIMIAEQNVRGKKRGREAMLLMFIYGIRYIGIKRFLVKISESNLISIEMFRKMNFSESERSAVFKEITYSRLVDDEWLQWIDGQLLDYQIQD